MRSILATSALLLLTACSGGNNGNNVGPGTTADLSIVFTESASDELAQFEVDVRNITLTKLNGNPVSALARSARVDFVELESVGELVAGLALEPGVYTTVTMDLDFANASVLLAGNPSPAAVRDQFGNPLTGIVPVRLDFAPGSRPVVGALRHNLFVLDLDLSSSVAVEPNQNTITFTPVLHIEHDPNNPKPIATKGVLTHVDFDSLTFTLERRTPNNLPAGTFSVQTGPNTLFQLDGTNSVGPTALGALPGHIGQCVWVQGAMTRDSKALQAVAVESGSGVPGNGQDWVLGHVVGLTGSAGVNPTLQVLGRSRDVTTGTRHFHTEHTVQLSQSNTKVLRRGAGNSLDTDAISVGQLVWVFGDLAGTNLDATTSTGVARLLPTTIFGIANGTPTGSEVTIDLVRFGHRDVSRFDFTVGGQPVADPNAFVVDVAGLQTQNVNAGAKLRLLGWLAAVGSTGPDATAVSLVNRTTTARIMLCQWLTPSSDAISANSAPQRVELDVNGALIRAVGDGFGVVNLNSTPAPTIRALLPLGAYRIIQNGGIEVNLSFDVFRQALLDRTRTSRVFRVSAFGTFDETTQEFAALTMTVVLD
ncbi:MAG: hypothetical protein NXI31_07455 [bacterium]|nr:hypothetical protein [bacterium]